MTAAGPSIRPADADHHGCETRSAATTQPAVNGLGGRNPIDETLVAYCGPVYSVDASGGRGPQQEREAVVALNRFREVVDFWQATCHDDVAEMVLALIAELRKELAGLRCPSQ